MMENMSSSQFFDWFKYFNNEPWGYEIDNYRYGIIASAVLNSVRSESSNKVWRPNDFFNFNKAPVIKKASNEQNFSAILKIQKIMNSKNNKENKLALSTD